MARFNRATQQACVRALNMCSERFRLGGPLGVYTPTALSRGSGWRAMTSFGYEALESDHYPSVSPFDENGFAPFER